MAKFSRIEVTLTMKESGLVPVFFNKDIEICKNVLKACYDGGTKVFEFTNRGDRAHLVFKELIIWAEKEAPEMILGVGLDCGCRDHFALYTAWGKLYCISGIEPRYGRGVQSKINLLVARVWFTI